MECTIWRCFLLVVACATAMAEATEANDKLISIEDLEELDDNLEELLSDEDHVVEKRWDQRPPRPPLRPSQHEYTAAAAATAHYGQQRLTVGGEPQLHQQQHHHHHEVQEMSPPRRPS